MAEIAKASPLEIGCWIDGWRGWRASARLVEIARGRGMAISDEDWKAVVVYQSGEGSADDAEVVSELADKAEGWLNEHVAPEGHRFGWQDGEFFLWTDDEWADGPG
jgi:hypothetical protein